MTQDFSKATPTPDGTIGVAKEVIAEEAKYDKFTISWNSRFVSQMIARIESDREALAAKDALIKELVELLARYRNETPLGHQPHMIAHVVDEALAKAKEAKG